MAGQHMDMKHYDGLALFWCVVVFLVIYLLLTFFNPDFVQREEDDRKTGQNDQAVTILWSLVILAIIVLILWVLYYAYSCAW